jgi:hemolysin activation/secretion protein
MAYNKLLNTTEQFDDMLAENERVARSFDDQFVPSASYTYSYDKLFGRLRRDRIVVQATLMSAGNLWAAVYGLLGQGGGAGSKRLFGDPFSQFFKETAEVRIYKQLGRAGVFAFRAMAGAGHAYGNSSVLPYTEQFYSGGANSIRAFTVRSLGPGTYRATSNKYGYFDQTGDLKLEINAEYRFRISGGLHGAVFFDAGNVWLLKDDPSRPGGKIGGTRFFNSVATGTGAGVRYDMSFLVIRFDLGVGIHLPYETSRTGYYNIPRFKDGLGYQLAIGYPF